MQPKTVELMELTEVQEKMDGINGGVRGSDMHHRSRSSDLLRGIASRLLSAQR